jgi:hypothetical protein
MTPNRTILFFGPAVLLTLSAGPSAAQIIQNRLAAPSDAATIDALTKRIETLESMVAQLQQQTAFIKSVNPLVFDASGAAVTIRGGQFSLEAASGFDIRSGGSATIRGGSAVTVDAAAGLDLKGAVIRLNGGDRPVACAGATMNGATGSGGGRLDHTHTIAVPLPACTSTVLVRAQ